MASIRLNNSVSLFARKNNRDTAIGASGSGLAGAHDLHAEPKPLVPPTPVSLYTRESSKSHVNINNHAYIDNNTRKISKKVAKIASHDVDDYWSNGEHKAMFDATKNCKQMTLFSYNFKRELSVQKSRHGE